MIELTSKAITSLREAAREIGEQHVTVATNAGVISFEFSGPEVRARALPFDGAPTRQELSAMFKIPLTAETA